MTERAPALEPSEPRPNKRPAALGLVVVYVGSAAGFVVGPVVKGSGLFPSRPTRVVIGLAFSWILVACVLLYVRRVERRPLSSIGFRGTRWTAYALAPVWWLGILIASVLFALLLRRADIDPSVARSILELPVWTKVLIVLTAAVTEEIMFHGYAIERLTELTGKLWLAATIAALVFVVFHMPVWGVVAGLGRSPGSLAMATMYVRRRSLGPLIVVHAMIDAPIVFLN